MSTIQTLLDDFPVSIDVAVAWGEMDAFQHVNNAVYIRWAESGRIAYFEQLALMNFAEAHRIGPILHSNSIRYRIPLTYPDTVSVATRIVSMESDRFTMEYAMVSHRHQKIAAQGSCLIVMFNYAEGAKALIPDEIRQRVSALEGTEF